MTDESVTISNISDAACFVLWSTFSHFVQCKDMQCELHFTE